MVVKDCRKEEEEAVAVVHANVAQAPLTITQSLSSMKITSRLSSVCRIFHELKLFCRSTLSFCIRKDSKITSEAKLTPSSLGEEGGVATGRRA